MSIAIAPRRRRGASGATARSRPTGVRLAGGAANAAPPTAERGRFSYGRQPHFRIRLTSGSRPRESALLGQRRPPDGARAAPRGGGFAAAGRAKRSFARMPRAARAGRATQKSPGDRAIHYTNVLTSPPRTARGYKRSARRASRTLSAPRRTSRDFASNQRTNRRDRRPRPRYMSSPGRTRSLHR